MNDCTESSIVLDAMQWSYRQVSKPVMHSGDIISYICFR